MNLRSAVMTRLAAITMSWWLVAVPAAAQSGTDPAEEPPSQPDPPADSDSGSSEAGSDSGSESDSGSGSDSEPSEPGSDSPSASDSGSASGPRSDSDTDAGESPPARPDAGSRTAPTDDSPPEGEPESAPEGEDEPLFPEEGDPLFPEDDDDLFSEDDDLSELFETDEELSMETVVVTAEAEPDERALDTGGAVVRLGAEELDRFNYDNPDAVVQQVPGAYVRQEDGYGLRPNIGLRGVSSERSSRITLLEDGVLFGPAPYAAPAAYFFPLMTRMTGVDVFMGAASIPFGPTTVGGAIDLQSRLIPHSAQTGLDLALGSTWFGRAHTHFGDSNEWGGFLFEGVYLRSDGFKHFQNRGDDDSLPSTGFDRAEFVLRTELHGSLADNVYQRLELRVGVSGELSNETYLGVTDEEFRADPYQRYDSSRLDRMEWWRTQIQVRHTLELGDDFRLRTTAYRHDLDRAWNKVNGMGGLRDAGGAQVRTDLFDVLQNPRGGNAVLLGILRGEEDSGALSTSNDYILIGENARRYGVTGLQSDANASFTTGPLGHRIRIGARLHHDSVDRNHTEDAYAMIGGRLIRATDTSYTTLRSHVEALALSAYAAWAVTIADTVTISPGIRTELIWTSYRDMMNDAESAVFRTAVLPGASAQWQIVPELSVFAGIMRGFAPVSPGQAENVRAEDSINYEAGARFAMPVDGTQIDAQLTGFVTDYQNFLQRCSFSAGCAADSLDAEGNGGQPIVGGVDLRLGSRVRVTPDIRVPLRASYTFTYSELRSPVMSSPSPLYLGGQPGDHLPYMPEHQVSAQGGVEMDEFGVNVSGTYVAPMWEAVGQGDDLVPRTDETFILDASAYVRIWGPLRAYIRGENLTYTQAVASRRPFGARPSRPLQVQVGVSLAAE